MKRHFFDGSDLILLAIYTTMIIIATVMPKLFPMLR